MTKTILTLKKAPHVPLEAEVISPDVFSTLTHDAVCGLTVFLGKRQLRLDEFFDVEGPGSENIEIHGDAARVKWIGKTMTRGSIKVNGNAGMHLGAYMKGGSIEVTGNASDWVGGEMKGGFIRVAGDAGGLLGAAYRGSVTGMSGGTILIGGIAGTELGMRMKRGTIVIGGAVRDFAGLQMKGGTIVLMSGAELRTGAWMARGTIISLKPIKLMPTFGQACTYVPTFLQMYARHLNTLGFSLPCDLKNGFYQRFTGDSSVPGKGEILVWQPASSSRGS